jgi:hypothetical protein
MLATLPLMFTITAVAYRDCFGVSGARLARGFSSADGIWVAAYYLSAVCYTGIAHVSELSNLFACDGAVLLPLRGEC